MLGFQAKYPGPKMLLRPVEMRFSYQESFAVPSPDAYETLLWDVMNNDPTLFMRADQVEAAWQLLMPVLEVWAKSHVLAIFPITPPAPGGRRRPTSCSRARGTPGGRSHEYLVRSMSASGSSIDS